MRAATCVLGVVVVVAGLTTGCASSRRAPFPSGSASEAKDVPPPPAAARPVTQGLARPAAPALQPLPPCAPPPCTPPAEACWSGCGLPCEQGLGGWHVRALGGVSYWTGTDAADNCGYFGADIGHSLCGSCFGVDGFYRQHTAQFDRLPSGQDGGTFHSVGAKATYQRSFNGSRWFGWVGAGPEYFWTTDYLHDDSGFGVFGEGGLGYVVSRHVTIRAGVNVEGMYTSVGRKDPVNDGDNRWLWVVAPVIGLEIDF